MPQHARRSTWTLFAFLVVAGPAWGATQVTVTSLNPTSPSILLVGTQVLVSFDYNTSQQSSRIVAIPYSAGMPSPQDSIHSDVFPGTGLGNGTCTFTILGGIVNVDELHLEMWTNTEPDSLLFSSVLPVTYAFNAKGAVADISFDPGPGAMMEFGDRVQVAFSYGTDEAAGVRVFFQPYSGYTAAPSSAFGPSVILPAGSGSRQAYFTLTSEPAIVDHVRVQMWRSNMSVLLAEAYLPILYLFGSPTAQQPVTWGSLKAKHW
jgi:hypothetical protein